MKAAIDEALDAKEKGDDRVIVFNLSGHGYLDLSAYDAFLAGKLEDYAYPDAKIQQALQRLPQVSLG